jgi:hypothetical protein
MTGEETILWRRLDCPGHEAARLSRKGEDWNLAGTAVFAHEGRPCRLDYSILCDSACRTSEAVVEGWVGRDPVRIEIEAASSGRWRMNGVERPEVEGSLDLLQPFDQSASDPAARSRRRRRGDGPRGLASLPELRA